MDVSENWTIVPDFDRYEAHPDGYVRVKATKHIMSNNRRDLGGYSFVDFIIQTNVKKRMLLSRVIALTFIPTIEGKPFCDHIDGNRANNSVSNLRWVSHTENAWNRVYKGAWKRGENKYSAVIRGLDGKRIHLGIYKTSEEASAVYRAKALELRGEFVRRT